MKSSTLKSVLILVTGIFLNTSLSQSLDSKIQTLLNSTMAANPEAIGIMIHVEAPDYSLSFTGTAGSAEKGKSQPIDPLQPALIASNTKTVVAAAIVRLAEQKKLELDQVIEPLLKEETRSALGAKGYQLNTITVRQLLSHTSGIIDYVNNDYFDTVHNQPQKQWTRDEQIALAISVADSLGKLGKAYSYGDINYLLATEIIETLTDKPFWLAIRELLKFEELGIKQMWFHTLEKQPVKVLPLVHQYWGKRDWDSYDFNPSWDLFGGGGQASTTKDLALFFQHLFTGKIVQDSTLLKKMYTAVLPREQSAYCLGLR
ncbi:MAG: serine hydrolase domain-containing protein, partial [Calditrichota bacterium]